MAACQKRAKYETEENFALVPRQQQQHQAMVMGTDLVQQPIPKRFWWSTQSDLTDNDVFRMFKNMAFSDCQQIAAVVDSASFDVQGMVGMEDVVVAFKRNVLRFIQYSHYARVIADARDINFGIAMEQGGNGRRSTVKKACMQCNIAYAEITRSNYCPKSLLLVADFARSGRQAPDGSQRPFLLYIDNFERLCVDCPIFLEEYKLVCDSPLVRGAPSQFWIVIGLTGNQDDGSELITLVHRACRQIVALPGAMPEIKADFMIQCLSMSGVVCGPTQKQLSDLHTATKSASIADIQAFSNKIVAAGLGEIADLADAGDLACTAYLQEDTNPSFFSQLPTSVETAIKLLQTTNKSVCIIRGQQGLKMCIAWSFVESRYIIDQSSGILENIIPSTQ